MGSTATLRKLVLDFIAEIPDKPIYHCKAHGEDVSEVCEVLSRVLKLSRRQKEILVTAGRLHDIGMLLKDEYSGHENLGAKLIRSRFVGDPFWENVAKTIAHEVGEVSEVLDCADLIGQCASTCYLPMFKKLRETLCEQYETVDVLFNGGFLGEVAYPKIKKYLELEGMRRYNLRFDLNRRICETAVARRIDFDSVISVYSDVTGIDCSAPNWRLGITEGHLEEILRRISGSAI